MSTRYVLRSAIAGLLFFLATGVAVAQAPDTSLTDSVRELREQIRELQSAVTEIRSESQRYRAETAELRRELEAVRAASSGTSPAVVAADTNAYAATAPISAFRRILSSASPARPSRILPTPCN